MNQDNNLKFLRLIKKVLRVIRPRFSLHYISYTVMIFMVIFSAVHLVSATTPNPGHPWTEVGDGLIQFIWSGSTPGSPITYTAPNVSTTLLTTNAAVTLGQGGTGQTSFTNGDLPYYNSSLSTTTLSKLAIGGNGTCLTSNGTIPSWGTCGSSYTFSTGLTNTSGTITANLSTGISGGQSVIGGTAASNNLTLSSTTNGTKGKILFGTSAYDEANNRLGILTSSPTAALSVGASNDFQVNSSGSIAAITGYTQGSGTMSVTSNATTGHAVSFSDSVLAPAASSTADILSLTVTNASTNTTGTSITAGLTVSATGGAGSGSGTHVTSAINIPAMGAWSCPFGGTCKSYVFNIASSNGYDDILNVGGTSVINSSGITQVQGGGTGFSSYTIGDLLYANTTTSFAKLADVATGSCLVSGGVGVAPSWGSCGSGTIGGSISTNQVAYGSGSNTITGSSSFTWDGTTLGVSNASTTASNKVLNISQTGATTTGSATDYAGYFSNTGAATTNVGLYATASGGTNNYAAIFDQGSVGIGNASPSYALDVTGTTRATVGAIIGNTTAFGGSFAGIESVRLDADLTTGGTYRNSQLAVGSASTNGALTIGYSSTGFGSIQAATMGVSFSNLALQGYGGNVGIGTTTPGQLLHLNGTNPAIRWTYGGGANTFDVFVDGNTSLNFKRNSTTMLQLDYLGNMNVTAPIIATTALTSVAGSGAGNTFTTTHTVNTSASYIGTDFISNITTSAANSSSIISQHSGITLSSSTNLPTNLTGYQLDLNFTGGGGTLNNIKGVNIQGNVASGGTVSTVYGVNFGGLFTGGSGAVTTQYGYYYDQLYITPTTGYAFYSVVNPSGGTLASATDISIKPGSSKGVIIGGTTPNATTLLTLGSTGTNGKVAFNRSSDGASMGDISAGTAYLNITGGGGVTIGISSANGILHSTNGTWMGKSTISNTAATALVQIPSTGSTAANNGQFKLDSQTLLATSEAGLLENNGTHLYFTFANGGTRYQLDQQSGGSGVTTVGTFSGSSQTNGANITGTTITFGPADTTNPGMVTPSGSQTFGGQKLFSNATTTGADLGITNTGVYTGTGIFNLTANSATTGTLASISSSSLTSGSALSLASSAAANFTGSLGTITLSDATGASSNTGSLLTLTNAGTANANTALIINHYATGSGNLAFRVNDVAGDTTPFIIDGNGNVGIGTSSATSPLTVLGNTSFTGTGSNHFDFSNSTASNSSGIVQVTATSSTDFIPTAKFNTTQTATGSLTASYGIQNFWTSAATVAGASVGQNAYGIYNIASKSGADTATGTYNLYASYNLADNTGRTAVGTVNTYGGYFSGSGDASGTSSAYGGYFTATGTADTNYGLYATASGGTNNYAAIFNGGRVGIGTLTPTVALEVNTAGTGMLVKSASYTGLLSVSNSGAWYIGDKNGDGNATAIDGDDSTATIIYTANSGHKFTAGSVTIGSSTLTSLFNVGSSAQFQVSSSGVVSAPSMSLSATGALTLGTSSSIAGQVTFKNATNSFTQTFTGSNPGASIEYILPTTAPTAGQVLSSTAPSSGVATLSWTTAGGGSQTPWTSDISAAGFDLGSLSNLGFQETTGAPTGTDVGFYRDNSGDLTGNVLTGKTFNLAVNNTDEYNFSSTALAMNSNNITGLGTNLTATAGLTISTTGANALTLTGGAASTWDVNGTLSLQTTNNGAITTGTGLLTAAGGITISANKNLTMSSGTGVFTQTYSGTANAYDLTSSSSTANNKAINVSQTGGTTGTDYAGYFSNTGSATTNVGLYTTASGGTTNIGLNVDAGQTLLGGTTLTSGTKSKLNIVSTLSTGAAASTDIAGIHGEYTFTNGGSSGFVQVGNRFVFTNTPTTNSNTMVGESIRVSDSSGLANLVRAVDITADVGSNTTGTNTGLRSTGATFGVQAITHGSAGGVSSPAGLYAENTGTTQGDVARFYTGSMTTGTNLAMLTAYHDTSTFSGDGLLMNMAVGSGTFNGNFLDLKNASVMKFKVNSNGDTWMNLATSTNNFAVCHETNGAGVDQLKDCSGAPTADYAEMYPVESGATFGDIVATGREMVDTYETVNGGVDWNTVKGKITKLVKSDKSYQPNVVGIVSDNSGDFTTAGHNIKETDNPKAIALNGRVPVKVASDSEAIAPGDYITTSGTESGKATKATKAGFVIGKALEAWSQNSGKVTVMVYVEQGFYNGENLTQFAGISTNDGMFARQVLQKFLANINNSNNQSSELLLDRLAVGTEIITPKVVADSVELSNINAGSSNSIGLILGPNGKFTIGTDTTSQSPVITFDSLGNATFAGTISAKEIKVGDISGITDLTNQINNLAEGQQAFTLTAQAMNTLTQALSLAQADIFKLQSDSATTNATIAGLTTSGTDFDNRIKIIESFIAKDSNGNVSGFAINALSVSGDSNFTGKVQFDGLSFFSNTTSFASGVTFASVTEFALPPLYNKDSAGYALIKQGDRRAKIVFEQPYIATPVVNTSITFENSDNVNDVAASSLFADDIRFIIVGKDQTGFTILLNKPATRDIRFSWNALSVKDPKVFESIAEQLGLNPDPTPNPNPNPTPNPTPEQPSTPTCVDPQILDTVTNTCVDPVPSPSTSPDPTSDPTIQS